MKTFSMISVVRGADAEVAPLVSEPWCTVPAWHVHAHSRARWSGIPVDTAARLVGIYSLSEFISFGCCVNRLLRSACAVE